MSGGSHDYKYDEIRVYEGDLADEQLEELLKDFITLLQDCEWWHSGDHSTARYQDCKQRFKEKWLKDRD